MVVPLLQGSCCRKCNHDLIGRVCIVKLSNCYPATRVTHTVGPDTNRRRGTPGHGPVYMERRLVVRRLRRAAVRAIHAWPVQVQVLDDVVGRQLDRDEVPATARTREFATIDNAPMPLRVQREAISQRLTRG